jgi:biotin-(acetyl-CoA carboxylase) ligase
MQSGVFGAGLGAPGLHLPPLLSEIALRESGDAFAHACAIAREHGAGTLVWVRRFDVAEFAVVLEPEEPLATARRTLYLGLVAMADALSAVVPPEKPVTFDWPDALRLDGALVGGGRLAWAEGPENDPPEWIVFGGMIRTFVFGDDAGGMLALGSSLEIEGADDADPRHLIESFARHLLVHVDRVQERGLKPICEDWLARLPPDREVRRGIDANGDLLIHRAGGGGPAERRILSSALASPTWIDPDSGMPWL